MNKATNARFVLEEPETWRLAVTVRATIRAPTERKVGQ